ncbi:GNAT family N-acetyltransferase [Streptomyces roseirectus]|uniref:GNAT family N-acetyltransferase n=1 Tax=Streptomyces roseirectus TaxID=2768066 RepID=A0A7H0IL31_9ACTN|nr:GNAT family N-acetyltransferase [Streptomyces roseirectus]QNP73497.1 GNAT family N-acetyltransferase [Streptomyces roseirectus]
MSDHFTDAAGRPHTVRDAQPADEPALWSLFQACADYFEAATGLPPAPGDVQSLFYGLPEGADWDDKRILVATDADGTVVALADVVMRYPAPEDCSVGLFLVHRSRQRASLGTSYATHLIRKATETGVRRITATVPRGWESGRRFLGALSFTFTGVPAREESRNRNRGPRETAVDVAELRVDGGAEGVTS